MSAMVFIAGMFAGAIVGISVLALLITAKQADRRANQIHK